MTTLLLKPLPHKPDLRITPFFKAVVVTLILWLTLVTAVNAADTASALSANTAYPDTVVLNISGLINPPEPVQLTYKALMMLPQHEVITSTAVTDGAIRFQGVFMRDLLDSVGAHGKTVNALALNGYSINIPTTDFQQFNVLVAWAADGQQLDPADKGPLWLIYPRDQFKSLQDIRYDYRWVWQLSHLTVK